MEKLGQRIADSELEGIWSWYQQMSNTPRKVLQDAPQSHGEDELELLVCLRQDLLPPLSDHQFIIQPTSQLAPVTRKIPGDAGPVTRKILGDAGAGNL